MVSNDNIEDDEHEEGKGSGNVAAAAAAVPLIKMSGQQYSLPDKIAEQGQKKYIEQSALSTDIRTSQQRLVDTSQSLAAIQHLRNVRERRTGFWPMINRWIDGVLVSIAGWLTRLDAVFLAGLEPVATEIEVSRNRWMAIFVILLHSVIAYIIYLILYAVMMSRDCAYLSMIGSGNSDLVNEMKKDMGLKTTDSFPTGLVNCYNVANEETPWLLWIIYYCTWPITFISEDFGTILRKLFCLFFQMFLYFLGLIGYITQFWSQAGPMSLMYGKGTWV